jgi:hypothetical protein
MNDSLHTEDNKLRPEKIGGPTVQEVHIDFLLEEELNVDPQFLRNFIQAAALSFSKTAPEGSDLESHPDFKFIESACQPNAQFELVSVKHSVSDQFGEADLLLIYRELHGNRDRVAVLIEDKIRATFQPRQAERYRHRGLLGKNKKEWDHFWTCLVAPENYIGRGHGFDVVLELEQIKKWFVSSDPQRAAFKTWVIDEAIRKASIIGPTVVDEIMTAFRSRYYELFEEFFQGSSADFRTQLPRRAWSGDSWFEFYNGSLPEGAYFIHKAPSGFVDLTFQKTTASRLKGIEEILETDMEVKQTTNSAAIRLPVPKIESFQCFDDEKAKIGEAFSAVTRLFNFYIRERSRLEPALLAARTANSNN